MLGYCGIHCDECAAYKGPVNTDVPLIEKVAGRCGDGAFSAPDWVCRGCAPADQNFLTKDCAACKVRGCAIEKPVRGRPACHGFEACGALRDFV